MIEQDDALHVIGGGLAGCEAAWQLAQRGHPVTLHEMRGVRTTAAHRTDKLGELVCSNTFICRSRRPGWRASCASCAPWPATPGTSSRWCLTRRARWARRRGTTPPRCTPGRALPAVLVLQHLLLCVRVFLVSYAFTALIRLGCVDCAPQCHLCPLSFARLHRLCTLWPSYSMLLLMLAAGRQASSEGRAPAMALCTPLDPSGWACTSARPSAPVVARLAALARRSLDTLQACSLAMKQCPVCTAAADFRALLEIFVAAPGAVSQAQEVPA